MNVLAILAIVVKDPESTIKINELLHENAKYINGRMGIPQKERNLSVISVILDAPQEVLNALSGKLGMLKGVTSKLLLAK